MALRVEMLLYHCLLWLYRHGEHCDRPLQPSALLNGNLVGMTCHILPHLNLAESLLQYLPIVLPVLIRTGMDFRF